MPFSEIFSLEEVAVENSTYNRSHLRKRLIRDGVIPYECQECGMGPEWRGKPLSLVLDHINGKNDDHRIENLRFLCPNCNSQTETFAGKNIITLKRTCPCGREVTRHCKSGLCRSCGKKAWHASKDAG